MLEVSFTASCPLLPASASLRKGHPRMGSGLPGPRAPHKPRPEAPGAPPRKTAIPALSSVETPGFIAHPASRSRPRAPLNSLGWISLTNRKHGPAGTTRGLHSHIGFMPPCLQGELSGEASSEDQLQPFTSLMASMRRALFVTAVVRKMNLYPAEGPSKVTRGSWGAAGATRYLSSLLPDTCKALVSLNHQGTRPQASPFSLPRKRKADISEKVHPPRNTTRMRRKDSLGALSSLLTPAGQARLSTTLVRLPPPRPALQHPHL